MNTLQKDREMEKNLMFIGTIYDSFEALEEILGKLKLEKPLFITHIAKQAFAQEIFTYAQTDAKDYKTSKIKPISEQMFLH